MNVRFKRSIQRLVQRVSQRLSQRFTPWLMSWSMPSLMPWSLRSFLQRFAVAGGITLGAIGSSQATVIVGSFDPAFGNGFANMGWRGEVRFDVPLACITPGARHTEACTVGRVIRAFVDLYDLTRPALIDHLEFDPTKFVLTGITVDNGSVIGLDADLVFRSAWLQPQGILGTAVFSGYKNYFYGLTFSGTDAFLNAALDPFSETEVNLRSQILPVLTFAPALPEPGSLGLFAGGMAALALIRRRPRRNQAHK